jgi:hypothetical protein
MTPIVEYDDGSAICLDSYTAGGHALGKWGELTLRFTDAYGRDTLRTYRDVALNVKPLTEDHVRGIVREEIQTQRPAWIKIVDRVQPSAPGSGGAKTILDQGWNVSLAEAAARAQGMQDTCKEALVRIDPESDELNKLYAVARAARTLEARLLKAPTLLGAFHVNDELLALRAALEKLDDPA